MSKLATVQRIKNVLPHTNADSLEIAEVLGWQVVVKKGEFNAGSLCIYVAIDSVLPDKPEFEFLRNKNFRIKPIRLRTQASNGICFPLSMLPIKENPAEYVVDEDVTEVIGVTKYEKPVPTSLAGDAYGFMPSFLKITDEDNLRTYPDALVELQGHEYYITRKDDGSSGTFFINEGEFGVCSRRIHLKESDGNGFWKMAKKYNLENALKDYFPDGDNVAVQGEVVGPGIQSNPLGLSELEFHAFSLYHIPTRSFYPFVTLRDFCNNQNIPMVTLVDMGDAYKLKLENLIKMANKLKYPNGKPAEGIVIRPQFPVFSHILNKPWSGKIISEDYED
jgi:RNA ligase (TIGR02306 family)